jgi:hypothetical protein
LGSGGGILAGGALVITNSTIGRNTAESEGGGISNFSGNVVVMNSTITNNLADSGIPPAVETAGGIENIGGYI